ncbi:hypothetical protein IBX73_11565 [candidate division WOR-3 bacterium]|nr:hypothetical protein [candidate division WOR-3 bacterium]
MEVSIGKGSDLEILEITTNLSKNISVDFAGSVCYDFFINIAPAILSISELSDSELMSLALHSGTYDFWDAPEENVYSFEDGRPV